MKTIEIIPPNKRLHTFRSYVRLVMTEEIIPPNKRLHTFRSYVRLVMTIEIIPANKRLHTFRSYVRLVMTVENLPPNKRLHTFRSYVLSVMTEEIIPPHGSHGARSRPPPSPKTILKMTARIDKRLEAYLKTCFPDRSNGIRAVYKPGSWQSNRYLQVPTILTADKSSTIFIVEVAVGCQYGGHL